jgi:hypothetical protein
VRIDSYLMPGMQFGFSSKKAGAHYEGLPERAALSG